MYFNDEFDHVLEPRRGGMFVESDEEHTRPLLNPEGVTCEQDELNVSSKTHNRER